MAQRAVAVAGLTRGESVILAGTLSEDIQASIRLAEALGAKVTIAKEENGTHRISVVGGGEPTGEVLDCGESGLSMRMFSSLAALFPRALTLIGKGSLVSRPMTGAKEMLSQFGVMVQLQTNLPPITVIGPIRAGKAEIDGSASSQYLTGLLIALPLVRGDSLLKVNNLKSKPYVEMTLELIADFGGEIRCNRDLSEFHIFGNQRYVARNYTVEGDWSGASFIAVAGAIGGEVTIENLRADSKQADRAILDAIKMFGAQVDIYRDSVKITRQQNNPFVFDATECPDLFPPLVSLATQANGTSRIRGVHRLKHKESDREKALITEFAKLGAHLGTEGDELVVQGSPLKGAKVFSHHDHRIAMALKVAEIHCDGPVEIESPECVSKSYPDFYSDMNRLMRKI